MTIPRGLLSAALWRTVAEGLALAGLFAGIYCLAVLAWAVLA